MIRQLSAITCAVALSAACSDMRTLPPYGEVVLIVDTDMPVPRMVNRLRIDVYTADGTKWLRSRDVLRPAPDAWPVSFSLYETDTGTTRDALVRLRAYNGAYIADYRGERFSERPPRATGPARFELAPAPQAPFATDDCPNCPRVLVGATDVTPATIPLVGLTIDRLVSVHLYPGVVRSARVTLTGSCAGTGADLAGLRTCVATEGTLVPVQREPLSDDLGIAPSKQGSFERPFKLPCAGEPRHNRLLHDGEVCVPGGVFVLGADNLIVGTTADLFPQRVASVNAFYMDIYEFSVGRLRDALAHGYAGPNETLYNDGSANDITDPNILHTCTMSSTPGNRENAPLNCVTQATARGLCQFYGGDLPTEAQWEYAATVVGRDEKTFGPPTDLNGEADCKGVAIARARPNAQSRTGDCASATAYATAAVTYGETLPTGDVTFGIVGLGGNVAELTKDAFASFGSICWVTAPIASTSCETESLADLVSEHGGSWNQTRATATYMLRSPESIDNVGPATGFRCVRRSAP